MVDNALKDLDLSVRAFNTKGGSGLRDTLLGSIEQVVLLCESIDEEVTVDPFILDKAREFVKTGDPETAEQLRNSLNELID